MMIMYTRVMTDRYDFPYPYFWRGDYRVDYPIVDAREAGYAPRRVVPAQAVQQQGCVYYPNHCFQGAPSTQYPCYPECTDPYIPDDNPYFLRPSKKFDFR